MPGKKGKKKKTKKSSKSKSSDSSDRKFIPDAIIPEYIAPVLKPGERLIKLLTTHPVDEKELHGFKVSTRALEQLSQQEITDLRLVFEVFDMNADGLIGPVELRKAMKALGFKPNREEARRMITDASLKGRSQLDFNEFLDVVIERQGESRDIRDEIMHGFKMFDYDNTGNISLDNLKQACTDAGVKFTDRELIEMIEEADVSGTGGVDKDEFVKVMLKTNLF